jgi:hypothetical protein
MAVQVMDVPIGCGDATDGLNSRILTVACAGAQKTPSSAASGKKAYFGLFMDFFPGTP